MANRYWIGGTGTWDASSTTHWSATSGGAGGASVPTSSDSVFFDANSFSGTGQIVTMTAVGNCLDMDWTGATNNPTLATVNINVYGSLTLIAAMSVTGSGNWFFSSTSSGKTITTSGISTLQSITFNGVGGAWTLQDDLSMLTKVITLSNGTLNTNGKTISCGQFVSNGILLRTLTLGSSTINLSIAWLLSTTTNLTFSAGTSTIILTGSGSSFAGGGLTYNNVTLSATTVTISGSNTFNTLTLTGGKTFKFTSSTTQTVTSLICNGTLANPSTLQAVTAGSAATIALPAGRYFIRHASIKDITVTGATVVTSIAGTNVSGNTGITFVTKFEIGRIKNDGSFNWYSTTTGAVTKVSG